VQFLILGVLGEYVGRAFLSANGKPQGVVREARGPGVREARGPGVREARARGTDPAWPLPPAKLAEPAADVPPWSASPGRDRR